MNEPHPMEVKDKEPEPHEAIIHETAHLTQALADLAGLVDRVQGGSSEECSEGDDHSPVTCLRSFLATHPNTIRSLTNNVHELRERLTDLLFKL